ncbi:hypothetical protein EX30DRAFT_257438 [Ascodesmis nigricans]|uniref:Uncharacterized protein n=1 Tax=Ascodesmis nigricans TaxID=341454 RepID=A0A4S2MHQ6_9PEZI|nr:hypothetical protein EX30DRAFT_257438 [Ascodesmis nigricans]
MASSNGGVVPCWSCLNTLILSPSSTSRAVHRNQHTPTAHTRRSPYTSGPRCVESVTPNSSAPSYLCAVVLPHLFIHSSTRSRPSLVNCLFTLRSPGPAAGSTPIAEVDGVEAR